MRKKITYLIIILSLFVACGKKLQNQPVFLLQLKTDSLQQDSTQLVVENDFYKVTFRARERMIDKFGFLDFCIRDWVLKSNQQDQIDICMDGSALRPFLNNIKIIQNDSQKKVVEMQFGKQNQFAQQYTFYPNNLFIDVAYLRYPTDWFNTVDIGTPGGITERFSATTSVYGQERWIRDLVYHEDVYWTLDKHNNTSADTNDLALEKHSVVFKNHIIMVVGNEQTGVGFGRVMPVWSENKGGVRTLKLLWDLGFENFPATGKQEVVKNNSFFGTIFLFEKGKEDAIKNARIWVEQKLKQN